MALRDTIRTLFKDAIGAEELIFANQNSPRPPLPYWVMQITTTRRLGRDSYSQGVDINGVQKVKGVREANVRILRIGADSNQRVNDLADGLSKVSVLEKFQLAKIALYAVGDVMDVPYKLDNNQFEPRSIVDVSLRFGSELIDTVGIIESIEVSAEFDEKADLSTVFTVVL